MVSISQYYKTQQLTPLISLYGIHFTHWPHVFTAAFEITAYLNIFFKRLGPSDVVPLEPLAVTTWDLLILLWIANRCLGEDLSLSSGLHNGSAVVFCPCAHPDRLILGSRRRARLPHQHPLSLLPPCGRHLPHITAPPWRKPGCVTLLSHFLPPCCPEQVVYHAFVTFFYFLVWCHVWKLQLIFLRDKAASVCPPLGRVSLWAVHTGRLLLD